MRNIEVKCRCEDLEAVRRAAEALGARDAGVLLQDDTFFHASNGRLKLRVFADGAGELISYHRSDAAEARGCDYFIYRTADPEPLRAALLDALGEAGRVRKQRRLFLYEHTRIHLDSVEGLGTFVELETVVTDQTDEDAREELERIATALGLRPEDRLAVAYVDLLGSSPPSPPTLGGLGG